MNGNRGKLNWLYHMFCVVSCIGLVTFANIPIGLSQYLNAGDRLPDLVIKQVKNVDGNEIDFGKLRGKLIVLDFWTVYCGGCIADMPRMEALQRDYDDSIQIILVTSSSQAEVERLLAKSTVLQSVTLPMIIGDTVLNQLFSFRAVPTHVWISATGTVLQVTGPYTNHVTLASHFDGLAIDLPQKNENKDFDVLSPILRISDGRYLTYLEQYSAIFKRINDDVGFMGVQLDSLTRKVVGYRMINQPITKLYAYAYAADSIRFDHQSSRIILEVQNVNRYKPPAPSTPQHRFWSIDNAYCYESFIPNAAPGDLKKALQLSLDQYFRLDISVQKRMVNCFVLTCVDLELFRRSQELNELGSLFPRTFDIYCDEFRAEVATIGRPFFVEFEFESEVILPIPDFAVGIEEFNYALARYGLELMQEIRELPMLIIRD